MAKARARTTSRKVKDRWKAKNWYTILAPSLFNYVPVAQTLAETPESLIGRVTEVSLQDITNDFRKSHIKLLFSIDKIEQNTAHTQLKGHLLTSDYLRRMIRRRKSRVDGVFDVETRDGALLRVKPFAIAEKRIQSSQKKLIRNVMNDVITKEGKAKTLKHRFFPSINYIALIFRSSGQQSPILDVVEIARGYCFTGLDLNRRDSFPITNRQSISLP